MKTFKFTKSLSFNIAFKSCQSVLFIDNVQYSASEILLSIFIDLFKHPNKRNFPDNCDIIKLFDTPYDDWSYDEAINLFTNYYKINYENID